MMSLFMLSLAADVPTQTPASPSQDVVVFKSSDILVIDAAGLPLFRGTREYILQLGNNPAAHVIAYDPWSRRVQVSRTDRELWIPCDGLEPMRASCPVMPPRSGGRGSVDEPAGASGPHGRGLPLCPGDPRCPKRQ